MNRHRHPLKALLAVCLAAGFTMSEAFAGTLVPAPAATASLTYADLADLADSAPLVLLAEVRKMAPVPAARAPGVRPGRGRFYIEARTRAMIAGSGAIGESLRYLADLPLDAKGKPPRLAKKPVLLFARPGARPGELQLVAPDGQTDWSPDGEAMVRAFLTERNLPDAPPRVTGVREAINVAGTLAGESDTQIFLATANNSAAAITVARRVGQPPALAASFSEVVDAAPVIPYRETLAWYRLACFLPRALPAGTNLSGSEGERAMAEADYRLAIEQLGACPRTR